MPLNARIFHSIAVGVVIAKQDALNTDARCSRDVEIEITQFMLSLDEHKAQTHDH